jgi:hypothetical protein
MSTLKLLGAKLALKAVEAKHYSGIPTARVTVSGSENDDGRRSVVAIVSAESVFGIPHALLSLRLTTTEARELAARLVAEADKLDLGGAPSPPPRPVFVEEDPE